jgi:hypothetical protein
MTDMRVAWSDHYEGEQNLLCPECHGSFLHQAQVTAYDRHEDAPTVVRIKNQRHTATVERVSNDVSGNPSDRRQGLAIAFYCETCPAELELTFAQHKGVTLLAWRKATEPVDKDLEFRHARKGDAA